MHKLVNAQAAAAVQVAKLPPATAKLANASCLKKIAHANLVSAAKARTMLRHAAAQIANAERLTKAVRVNHANAAKMTFHKGRPRFLTSKLRLSLSPR